MFKLTHTQQNCRQANGRGDTNIQLVERETVTKNKKKRITNV